MYYSIVCDMCVVAVNLFFCECAVFCYNSPAERSMHRRHLFAFGCACGQVCYFFCGYDELLLLCSQFDRDLLWRSCFVDSNHKITPKMTSKYPLNKRLQGMWLFLGYSLLHINPKIRNKPKIISRVILRVIVEVIILNM